MNRIMKLAGILLMGFILAYMGGCASAGGEEKAASKKAGAEQAASPKGRPDVLVAYFSQTGNTRTVAQKIAARAAPFTKLRRKFPTAKMTLTTMSRTVGPIGNKTMPPPDLNCGERLSISKM